MYCHDFFRDFLPKPHDFPWFLSGNTEQEQLEKKLQQLVLFALRVRRALVSTSLVTIMSSSPASRSVRDVSLPMTRVKTIMKSSPDVETVSQESLFLITKATVSLQDSFVLSHALSSSL